MAKEKCDRDCSTCNTENRSFCAVQMAIANQEILLTLVKKVDDLSIRQEASAELISPACNTGIFEPTGSGAETIND